MTHNEKSIFTSKTFWGAIVQLLGAIGLAPAANIDPIAAALVIVAGFVLTVYGRIKAKDAVTI